MTQATATASKDITSTRYLVSRLWREHTSHYLKQIFLALFFMCLTAAATAGLAYLMDPVISEIFISKDPRRLYQVAICILVVFVVKGFASYGESVTMAYVGQRIVSDIQIRLFGHLMTLDLSFFHRIPSGSLIARFTNDVGIMRSTVANTITSIGKDLFTLMGLVGVMFYQDPILACIAFFVFPVAILPIVKIGKRMRKVSISTQAEQAELTTLLSQVFQGSRVVKAYGTEDYEKKRAKTVIERILDLIYKSSRVRDASRPIMETLGGIAIVSVISYGGYQAIFAGKPAGEFVSFITAVLMAYEPMKKLANLNANLQEGLGATSRVFQLLDESAKIKNSKNARFLRRELRSSSKTLISPTTVTRRFCTKSTSSYPQANPSLW